MGQREDMKKGKVQIEHEIYSCLVDFFQERIDGTLYMSDTRPRDSKEEDAVIQAGDPSGSQIQKGRVRILIFIQDIDNGTGAPVPNIERILELEPIGQEIIDTLHDQLSDYSFEFLTAPTTGNNTEAREHFVNINLQYSRQTF